MRGQDPVRIRQITSAIAHYIAGVLDRESMVEIVEGMYLSVNFQIGNRVKSVRGTTVGTIVRILPDGRVVWRPDGSKTELISLAESLLRA